MSKIKGKRGEVKRISQLPVLNPQVAGIDVSDTEKIDISIDVPRATVPDMMTTFADLTRDIPWLPRKMTGQLRGNVLVKSLST